MAIRPIVLYPHPALLTPTQPVPIVDDEVRGLVQDMVETMYRAAGIGLAANQLGVPRRICVVDLSAGEDPASLVILVNPRVTESSGSQVGEEGCLSFPDILLDIERPSCATVEALDDTGRPFSLTAEGLLARAILHECEHLEGKTFLQNVSALKRELVKKRIRKLIKSGEWVETATR